MASLNSAEKCEESSIDASNELVEDDRPPPCDGEVTIPPPANSATTTNTTSNDAAGANGEVDEKESFISERHQMIAGILRHSARGDSDVGNAVRVVTATAGSLNSSETAVAAAGIKPSRETATAAAQLSQMPLEADSGHDTNPIATDGSSRSLVSSCGDDQGQVLPLSSIDQHVLGKARAVTTDDEVPPPPGKARRTDAFYMLQPGAFPVEGTRGTHDDENSALEHSSPIPTGSTGEMLDLEVGVLNHAPGASTIAATVSSSPSSINGSDFRGSNLTVGGTPIEAIAVSPEDEARDRADLEQELRQKILLEAVPAEVIGELPKLKGSGDNHYVTNKDTTSPNSTNKRKLILIAAFVAIAVLAVGLGVGLGSSNNKDTSSVGKGAPSNGNTGLVDTATSDASLDDLSTLEQVRQRGYVRCGVTEFGFVSILENSGASQPVFEGFNVQQCRAMAMLALGDPDKYEIVLCDHYTRFSYLTNYSIDIMTEAATHTMGRDVWRDAFEAGYTFATPHFYAGLNFAGNPAFVDCADELDSFYGDCRSLKICVLDGSTHIGVLEELLQGSAIVPYNGTDVMVDNLLKGVCNVIAGEPLYLTSVKDQYLNGTDAANEANAWKMGSRVVSKEPLAMVTRHGDPEWSALADAVTSGLILSEAKNISKDNAQDMAALFNDGGNSTGDMDGLAAILVSLVAEFGNYGDLYRDHVSKIPRDEALNRPYEEDATTGLLYALPFGDLLGNGPDPQDGGTLNAVLERGFLTCGVRTSRGPAFVREVSRITSNPQQGDVVTSDWLGFDVEFCRALAGSLFVGSIDQVVFVAFDNSEGSYAALASGEIDLVAGARVTLQASYREPTSGRGYHFSMPYYYDNDTKDGFALMTRNDDDQWSSFVDWVIIATVYAEEKGITAATATDMPVVTLFGESLKQMFADCISSTGSYSELYNRTLQEFIPRGGANRLNDELAGPQMFPVPAI